MLAETLRQVDFEGNAVFEIRPRNVIQSAFFDKQFEEKLFKQPGEANGVHTA